MAWSIAVSAARREAGLVPLALFPFGKEIVRVEELRNDLGAA